MIVQSSVFNFLTMRKVIVSIFFLSGFCFSVFSQQINENLIESVIAGDSGKVKEYLSEGADANYVDYYGYTPLVYAAEKGDTAVVAILLQYNANPDFLPKYSPSPLGYTAIYNFPQVAELLLKAGANPDITDNLGYTPLSYAVYYGSYETADVLLFYGANPNKRVEQWSPLDLAVFHDDTVLVDMLVYYNADLTSEDDMGNNVMHVAASNNSELATELLIKKGVDFNSGNNEHATPLALSVYCYSNEVGNSLLANGARTDVKVGKFTPYQISILRQNYKFRRVLNDFPGKEPIYAINYFIDARTFFWYDDILIGSQIGIKGLYTNIEWYLGLYIRPFEKRVIIQQSDNLYYQFWEKSTGVYVGSQKNIFLFQKGSHIFFVSPQLQVGYGLLSYSGLSQKKFVPFFSPGLGLMYVHDSFRASFGVSYMNINSQSYSPVKCSFTVGYRLNNVKFKLKVKDKPPFENESVF